MDTLEAAARHIIAWDGQKDLSGDLTVLSDDLARKQPRIFKKRGLIHDLLEALLTLHDQARPENEESLIENCALFLCSNDTDEMRVWMRELVFAHVFEVLRSSDDELVLSKNLSFFSDLVQYNTTYSFIATDTGAYAVLGAVQERLEKRDVLGAEGENALGFIGCIVSDLLSDDTSSHAKFVESDLFKGLLQRLKESKGDVLDLNISILNDAVDNLCDEYMHTLVDDGVLDVLIQLVQRLLEASPEGDEGEEEKESESDNIVVLVETLFGLMKYDRESNSGALLQEFLDKKDGKALLAKLKNVSDEDLEDEVRRFEKVFIHGGPLPADDEYDSEEEEEEEEEEAFGDVEAAIQTGGDEGRYFDGPVNIDEDDYDLDSPEASKDVDQDHVPQSEDSTTPAEGDKNKGDEDNDDNDDLYW